MCVAVKLLPSQSVNQQMGYTVISLGALAALRAAARRSRRGAMRSRLGGGELVSRQRIRVEKLVIFEFQESSSVF